MKLFILLVTLSTLACIYADHKDHGHKDNESCEDRHKVDYDHLMDAIKGLKDPVTRGAEKDLNKFDSCGQKHAHYDQSFIRKSVEECGKFKHYACYKICQLDTHGIISVEKNGNVKFNEDAWNKSAESRLGKSADDDDMRNELKMAQKKCVEDATLSDPTKCTKSSKNDKKFLRCFLKAYNDVCCKNRVKIHVAEFDDNDD